MRTGLLFAVLAFAASSVRAAEPTSRQAVVRAFAAAASAKERLKEVPAEFAGMVLVSLFQAESESPLLVPKAWPEMTSVLDEREAYWGGHLDAVLAAKRRCDSENVSGLIAVASLTDHAKECSQLMSARGILEAILEDVAKDKVYVRLKVNEAGTRADDEALLERKRGIVERIWRLSLGLEGQR